MKILHVIPGYEPAWAFGGTVTATANLCRGLVKQGVDVSVYATNADGKGGALAVPLNVEVSLGGVKTTYFAPSVGGTFYSRTLAEKLQISVKDYALVHLAAVWQLIQADAANTCQKAGIPYVVSSHGSLNPWSWTQKPLKKKCYWQFFGKKSFLKAAALHYTCQEERLLTRPLFEGLSPRPSFVVPNGIDTGVTKRLDMRERFKVPSEKLVLLYAGRIHRKKGLDLVIKALMQPGMENFYLILVGYPEDAEHVKYLKELGGSISNRIVWYGAVPADEVRDCYYAADLFVLPSQDENFGMVVVEAMACGLPVLISRNVGIWREIEADGAGFIVNRDSRDIHEALRKIAASPEMLKNVARNAVSSAHARYDISAVAGRMARAYSDVLKGSRSGELAWE